MPTCTTARATPRPPSACLVVHPQAPSWEPPHRLPACLVAQHLDESRAAFNRKIEPLLARPADQPESSGVVATSVPRESAAACATYLRQPGVGGRLALQHGTKSCFGYTTYGKVLAAHDSEQQRTHTLLITHPLLPLVRDEVPGFAAIEEFLVGWLHAQYGTVVELYFAHGLRQSPHTLKSTGFDVHQDVEDFAFIEYTVVVKLTPDQPEEPPSQMRIVGAPRYFSYGPASGDAGAFRARAFHASVEPAAECGEHLKVAYFFRASDKGDRRAKRALAAEGGARDEQALAQRRQRVVHEMTAFNFAAKDHLELLRLAGGVKHCQ